MGCGRFFNTGSENSSQLTAPLEPSQVSDLHCGTSIVQSAGPLRDDALLAVCVARSGTGPPLH